MQKKSFITIKVYTRYLQIWGMKGKYYSVYNIKIKRYCILVRFLYGIILHSDNA